MTNTRVSNDEFKLDTSGFDAAADSLYKLAVRLNEVKTSVEREKNHLMDSWVGDGRNAFEKRFHIMNRKLTDIRDDLFEIRETILKAEEEYIQADTAIAKSIDDVQSRSLGE